VATFLDTVAELAYCNPFSPERIRLERQALGDEFRPGEAAWSLTVDDPSGPFLNGELIAKKTAKLLESGGRASAGRAYEGAVLYLLYYRYSSLIYRDPGEFPDQPGDWSSYGDFRDDWDRWFGDKDGPAHVFAIYYQMRRAFFSIYRHILGGSPAAARLRAAVWQSIFTHDMRRYRCSLFRRMGDFSTLIVGESGTGKELVARAIALSRYIPFDESKRRFREGPEDGFHAVNLAALSPTLIESELFGHRRGAFTGATQDRKGWLESCPAHGTVFLDEIGDLDATLQVKLLRVIQTRKFQRVGETADRDFPGKIVAATNRDLAAAVARGEFREDFYYRLCSDVIETVPLAAQVRDDPATLRPLVRFMARRIAGEESEDAAAEAERWIAKNLGREYDWPGNYRELEQCVRNVLIRGEYRPLASVDPATPAERLAAELSAGELTADEVLRRYVTLIYARTGSYAETARRIELDQRTVKSKVDRGGLAALRASRN